MASSLQAPFFQQHLLICVSLSHCDISHDISNFSLYYGHLRSVIFDVTIVIVLGCLELHPYKMVNLIDGCVLTAPSTGCSPSLSLSLDFPVPCDTTILKAGQSVTLQWHLSVQVNGRVSVSHFKSKAKND